MKRIHFLWVVVGMVIVGSGCSEEEKSFEPLDYCALFCSTRECGDDGCGGSCGTCSGERSVCIDGGQCVSEKCGNGTLDPGEACDDGNHVPKDYCSSDCLKVTGACGDAIKQKNEECDDGNDVDTDACIDCVGAVCGDGVVWENAPVWVEDEECDDANEDNTDNCVNCQNAGCGDGFVQTGKEACDDGNQFERDACLNTCVEATCGDGVIYLGEEACDDGENNGSGANYCDADCSLGGNMVVVPAGEFIYGNNQTMTAARFVIDIYEVTAGEYNLCVQAGSCAYNGGTEQPYFTYNSGRSRHPINGVTWQEAYDYCHWKGKRLPTEVEWEKAARGDDGRTYPWGEEEPTCDYAVMDLSRESFRRWGCDANSTREVGTAPAGASPYGVLDMAGNVWEWTDSWFDFSEVRRVIRGGGFKNKEEYLNAVYRGPQEPGSASEEVGFRCIQ